MSNKREGLILVGVLLAGFVAWQIGSKRAEAESVEIEQRYQPENFVYPMCYSTNGHTFMRSRTTYEWYKFKPGSKNPITMTGNPRRDPDFKDLRCYESY